MYDICVLTRFVFFILVYCFTLNGRTEDVCIQWFKNAAIKIDSNCKLKCSTLAVDMGTFDCPNKCANFCKKSDQKSPPLTYPKGLTKGDGKMAAKYPTEALIVYKAKNEVDKLTLNIFKNQGHNDESDAFRHFVWAALITKELGLEKANEFLNAHEDEESQPLREKEMDLANNKSGSDYVVNKIREGQTVELDQIEKAALEKLRANELKILNPSQKKIPDGYYSK